MPVHKKFRSFKRVSGSKSGAGPSDAGSGYNSLGGRRSGRQPSTQNDASNGMVRNKSQAGSTAPGKGKGKRR